MREFEWANLSAIDAHITRLRIKEDLARIAADADLVSEIAAQISRSESALATVITRIGQPAWAPSE